MIVSVWFEHGGTGRAWRCMVACLYDSCNDYIFLEHGAERAVSKWKRFGRMSNMYRTW